MRAKCSPAPRRFDSRCSRREILALARRSVRARRAARPWVVLASRTGSGTSLRRPEELRIWAGQAEAQRFGAQGPKGTEHGARRAERFVRALPAR